MRRVLLTRALHDSALLARELERWGYKPLVEPLLNILPIHVPMPDLAGVQAVMFTSAHAFDYLAYDPVLCRLPCFCVGAHTAKAANEFGFILVEHTEGDGAILANTMIQKLKPDNGTLLHIAGRDTDSRGRDRLQEKGFHVKIWATYYAETSSAFTPATIQQFREGSITAVLLFSTRTTETCVKLIRAHGLEDCCQNVTALTISDTVAQAAGAVPWHGLIVARQPTQDALLQSLQKFLPVSEVP